MFSADSHAKRGTAEVVSAMTASAKRSESLSQACQLPLFANTIWRTSILSARKPASQ
jgi:hypothetical protein